MVVPQMLLRGRILQIFTFCGGCFSILQCGFNMGWPSYVLPHFLSNSSTIPMTNDEGSWIASMHLIGGICGAVIIALTLDIFGRKTMLLIALVLMGGTWLIIAFARTILELFVARFVLGICDGVSFSCVPLYLAEVSNPKIRGMLINGTQVLYFFGVFLPNLLVAFLSIYVIALISSAFALVGVLFYLFVPESPHFYLIKGDVTRARDSIERFSKGSGKDVDSLLNSIKNSLKERSKGKWKEIFTDSSNRKSFFLLLLARMFQTFCGYMGIMFYAQNLFKEVDADINPIVFVNIFYLLQIAAIIVNAVVVDRIGRRPLMIVSISVVTFSLSLVSVYFTLRNVTDVNVSDYSWCPILGLFIYITGYTLGLQSVVFLLCNEIFPLHVKTVAVSILAICYSVLGTVVSKFFQFSKDEFGVHVPFIVFTLVSMCGVPFSVYFIPETKRKTLEEIQDTLRSKQQSNVE
ncbi:hypothetical protein FQR65_LT14694 [Abscondita terminalis]|nr:hypothetical protein FQR65_LT14694 [Abscondita terminalis]